MKTIHSNGERPFISCNLDIETRVDEKLRGRHRTSFQDYSVLLENGKPMFFFFFFFFLMKYPGYFEYVYVLHMSKITSRSTIFLSLIPCLDKQKKNS